MEHDRRVDPEMTGCRIGPGDRRYLVAEGRLEFLPLPLLQGGDGDVAGLMEQVAGIEQPPLVHHERPEVDVKTGRKVDPGRSSARTSMPMPLTKEAIRAIRGSENMPGRVPGERRIAASLGPRVNPASIRSHVMRRHFGWRFEPNAYIEPHLIEIATAGSGARPVGRFAFDGRLTTGDEPWPFRNERPRRRAAACAARPTRSRPRPMSRTRIRASFAARTTSTSRPACTAAARSSR